MPGSPPSFLVIRRDNIGDLVCTTPLFRALRERFPTARICALVNSYNAAVLQGNPDVDEIFAYTKAKHRPIGQSVPGVYFERIKMLARLRAQRFDYAVLAAPGFQERSLLLARMIRPRHILGFIEEINPIPRRIDIAVQFVSSPHLHEAEEVFRLLQALGIGGTPPAASVFPDAAEISRAQDQLARIGHKNSTSPCRSGLARDKQRCAPPPETEIAAKAAPTKDSVVSRQVCEMSGLDKVGTAAGLTIGIHISARKPSQRWPAERFSQLVRLLHEQFDARFMLFWSPGDENNPLHPGDDGKAAEIMSTLGDVPILPYPTQHLPELIAGLSLCDAVVCSDGGAMHLAAGVSKPILCFFGQSDATRWHPWGVPYVLLQPESREVRDISVADAVAGFGALMEK